MKNKTALIIEDNEANRILIRDILLELGMITSEAQDAEIGIEIAQETLPDIIIMDYKLPGMNGFVATTNLKTDTLTKHIPIVILTASAFEKDKHRAIDAGCDAFLTKPIEINSLIQTMESLLGVPAPENTPSVEKDCLL